MDSFEFNKLIGALLGTVFVVFSIGLISDAIFASPAPEKPGFAIAPRKSRPTAAGGRGGRAASRSARLLATADAEGRRGGLQEMRGLPYRRKGRRQQGRPRICGASSTVRSPRMRASPIRPA